MDLRELPGLAEDYPAYQELKKALAAGGITQLEGLPLAAKGWLLAQLGRETKRPLAIISYNAEQAQRLCADLARYGVAEDELVSLVSSTETLIFGEGAPDLGQTGQRIAALQALARGSARVTVGPIGAWLQRTVPAALLQDRRVMLAAGETVDIGGLEKNLIEFGYERVEAVELPGQWTRRGGILDVFPGDANQPFRVDFFGDDIESIRPFDIETQRSVGKVEKLRLSPVREVPYDDAAVAEAVARLQRELPGRMAALRQANLDNRGAEHAERLEERVEGDIAQLRARAYFDAMEYYGPYLYPEAVCALDYLPADALIVLDEPSQAKARWEQRETEIAEITEARAARGEYLTPDMPHACGFEAVIQKMAPPAPTTVDRGGAGEKPGAAFVASSPAPPELGAGGGHLPGPAGARAGRGQDHAVHSHTGRGDGKFRGASAGVFRGPRRLARRALPMRHRQRTDRADAADTGRA